MRKLGKLKTLTLLLFSSLNFTCFAGDGVYFGGSFGGNMAQGNLSGATLPTLNFGVNSYLPIQLQNTLLSPTCGGWLYLGYGARWQVWSLALEGFIQNSTPSFQNFNGNGGESNGTFFSPINAYTITDLSSEWLQYGVDLCPGFYLSPLTRLYARFGTCFGQSTLNSFSTSQAVNIVTNPATLDLSSNLNKWAFRFGGGWEQYITRKISLRADYVGTHYGTVSLSGNTSSTGAGGFITLVNNSSLQLSNHAVLLGAVYHPCSAKKATLAPKCSVCMYNGLYYGGTAGGFFTETKQSGQFQNNLGNTGTGFTPSQITVTPPPFLMKQFYQGSLYTGFGKQWKRFFLGSEIFAQASQNQKIQQQTPVKLDVIIDQSILDQSVVTTTVEIAPLQYGIDVRPGWLLSPQALLYARAGTSLATITATSNTNFFGFDQHDPPNYTYSLQQNLSKRLSGCSLRLGVGLEQVISRHLRLRGDYTFTNYGFINLSGNKAGTTNLGAPTSINGSMLSRFNDHALSLGLCYYFTPGKGTRH
ncbi:MAG: hypothetical protein JSS62_00225 [Verrucomicrobia bacterium]|nr:hypothetical protein [Verrucomicrobiota bacterium]MBS0646561.1 hypothetical protein [Verrucomicrobiota bacterium]